jgi:hypothetical protein
MRLDSPWGGGDGRAIRAGAGRGHDPRRLDPGQLAETAVGGFIGAQALTDQLGDKRLAERVEALVRFVRNALEIQPAGSPSEIEEEDSRAV